MNDISSENKVLQLFNQGNLGPYLATWVLSKKFNKGYKSILKYLQIDPLIIDEIKTLSTIMYRSKVFTKKAIIFIVKKPDMLSEESLKKLVAISGSINLVRTIDIRKTDDSELYIIYKNDTEDILVNSTTQSTIRELPDFDLSTFKFIMQSDNALEKVCRELNEDNLSKLRELLSPDKQEDTYKNHVDDILSAFNL